MFSLLAYVAMHPDEAMGYEFDDQFEYVGNRSASFKVESYCYGPSGERQRVYLVSGDQRKALDIPQGTENPEGYSGCPFDRIAISRKEDGFIIDRKVVHRVNDAYLYTLGRHGFYIFGNMPLNRYIFLKDGYPPKAMCQEGWAEFVLPIGWTRSGKAIVEVNFDADSHAKWYRVEIDPKTGWVSKYMHSGLS